MRIQAGSPRFSGAVASSFTRVVSFDMSAVQSFRVDGLQDRHAAGLTPAREYTQLELQRLHRPNAAVLESRRYPSPPNHGPVTDGLGGTAGAGTSRFSAGCACGKGRNGARMTTSRRRF